MSWVASTQLGFGSLWSLVWWAYLVDTYSCLDLVGGGVTLPWVIFAFWNLLLHVVIFRPFLILAWIFCRYKLADLRALLSSFDLSVIVPRSWSIVAQTALTTYKIYLKQGLWALLLGQLKPSRPLSTDNKQINGFWHPKLAIRVAIALVFFGLGVCRWSRFAFGFCVSRLRLSSMSYLYSDMVLIFQIIFVLLLIAVQW